MTEQAQHDSSSSSDDNKKVTPTTSLYAMMEAAMMEDREGAFLREVFSTACMMMWHAMDPETEKYVDKCSQEIRQHIEGKVDIWNWGKPKGETA